MCLQYSLYIVRRSSESMITQKAGELGALLRPIGNTLYWLPPLNMSVETADELAEITKKVIKITC